MWGTLRSPQRGGLPPVALNEVKSEGWWRLALYCRTSFDPEYATREQK